MKDQERGTTIDSQNQQTRPQETIPEPGTWFWKFGALGEARVDQNKANDTGQAEHPIIMNRPEIKRVDGKDHRTDQVEKILEADPHEVHRRRPGCLSARSGEILRHQVGRYLQDKSRPNNPRREKQAKDKKILDRGWHSSFLPPPLSEIKQAGTSGEDNCIGVRVICQGHERGHDQWAMTSSHRVPR